MKPVPIAIALVVLVLTVRRWRTAGNRRRLLGLVAVAGLAVYGSGVVDLPNLSEASRTIGRTLGPFTYPVVGLLAFLETGAFVGLVAPGETAIIIGGVIAGQGRISVVVLIAVVWASAAAGDAVSYFIGRRLGRDFLIRHGPRFKITRARLERVEGFFARHGGKAILLGRFVGLVRAVLPFVAGASRLPLRRYLPYDIVGSGLWGTAYVLLGYVFWRSIEHASQIASRGAFALAVVIVGTAGALFAYRHLRERRRRAGSTSAGPPERRIGGVRDNGAP